MATALSIPTFGYPSGVAWAAGLAGAQLPVAVTLDARRKEIYGALLRAPLGSPPESLLEVRVQDPREWFGCLAAADNCADGVNLVGDGARLYAGLAREILGDRAHFGDAVPTGASVAWMARDGIVRLESGDPGDGPLRPIYLRDHDAAIARKKFTAGDKT
jgi:tRNA A37 threonylcarbamoyladenosine modification protein TsaB